MFDLFRSTDDKIEDIEKKITELSEQNLQLNLHADNLWRDLKVTPAQMKKFLEDPANFTEENWQQIQMQKKVFLEQLKKQIDSIQNPLKTKQRRKQQQSTSPQWLFVK